MFDEIQYFFQCVNGCSRNFQLFWLNFQQGILQNFNSFYDQRIILCITLIVVILILQIEKYLQHCFNVHLPLRWLENNRQVMNYQIIRWETMDEPTETYTECSINSWKNQSYWSDPIKLPYNLLSKIGWLPSDSGIPDGILPGFLTFVVPHFVSQAKQGRSNKWTYAVIVCSICKIEG